MNVKLEKTDKANEVKLEFTVEEKTFEKGIQTVFQKNSKYFNIPGFRKGKAPFHIVEKQYGVEIFYEDAFNEVVPEIYEQGIKENKLEVVSKPEIDIVQMEKGKDLIFTAMVQIKPEVVLGKYKGIQIKKIAYTVEDKDIDHEIEHMAEHNARIVAVADREVKDGDIAVIDFEGFVGDTPFEGGKAENHELTIGSKTFIPGFEDQVIGMKPEEEKDIKVTFPKEYFSEELAGKDAVFKVKLHEIKMKELPKIDDEFAKDVSEFETLSELKNSIKEKKEKELQDKAKYETENAVLEEVIKDAKMDVPSGMIETEIDNMQRDIETKLQYQGMKLEQYLEMMGKNVEEFRKDYETEALKSVKTRLIIDAVQDAEKIEVAEEELEEKMKEMGQKYGKKEEEVKENEGLKTYLTDMIKAQKTIDFLVENAKITK